MYVFPLIFAFLVVGVAQAEYFKYEKCKSGDDEYLSLSEFKVEPDPINLKKKNMTVTLRLNLKRELPEKTKLKTAFYKLKSIFGVKFDYRIGCLLGKFGSCTKPFCKYLEDFKEQGQPLFPKDVPYGCPLKPGDYGGDNITIPIPDLGPIARFVVGGKYRTELELVVDGKVTDCYKFWTEMK